MKIKVGGMTFTAIPSWPAGLDYPIQILSENAASYRPEESVSLQKCDTPDKLASRMLETDVWNSVQDDTDGLESRLSLAARLIEKPEAFFKTPSEMILGPEAASVEKRWSFRSTAEKDFVMRTVHHYVSQILGAKGVAPTVMSISDELFTNALFNAPFGDLDSTLDRTTLVVLNPEMSAEIIVGNTQDRILIGCIDVFGTLNCENLLERIYKGFSGGIGQALNMETGGAGIGILRMVDLSSDIYVVVEKDKRTLVACSFMLKRSSRKTRETGKNFYFQSFQIIEGSSAKIRIERRGTKVFLRLSGNPGDDFPYAELDLNDSDEVVLDLRALDGGGPRKIHGFLELFKNSPSIRKIELEYVPGHWLTENLDLWPEGALSRVKSLVAKFHCTSCKVAKDFIFNRDEKLKDAPAPACPACKGILKPDEKIQKFMETGI